MLDGQCGRGKSTGVRGVVWGGEDYAVVLYTSYNTLNVKYRGSPYTLGKVQGVPLYFR